MIHDGYCGVTSMTLDGKTVAFVSCRSGLSDGPHVAVVTIHGGTGFTLDGFAIKP